MNANISQYRQTVNNYKGLLSNLDNMISESHFKMSFFLEKLNMKRATFYNKRKNGKFEPEEVDQILKILSEQ